MALAGQNQVRHIYVAKSAKAVTDVGDIDGGTIGDLAVINANGADAVVAAGSKFLIALKETKGTVTSDVVDPGKVSYAKSKPYAAKTATVGTIGGITADANTLYTVEIAISSHGSFSAENEYIKKAFYKAAAGDDAEAIVDGLIVSLNRNFARELDSTASSNPYFAFTKTGATTTAALVITEKLTWATEQFDADKKTRQGIQFTVNASFTTLPTILTNVQGAVGSGTYMQVAEIEFYLKGERGDFMRQAGYPHNLPAGVMEAVVGGTYDIIELGFYEEGRDEAKKSKKGMTLAFPVGDRIATNLFIAELNTAITSVGDIAALA
jgi:hypothetical protein